jgi:hypothetical protein
MIRARKPASWFPPLLALASNAIAGLRHGSFQNPEQ